MTLDFNGAGLGALSEEDILTVDDWKMLSEIQHILKPLYDMTMQTQGWGTAGGQGRLWEVLTGIEFILEHLENWKILYNLKPSNLAAGNAPSGVSDAPSPAWSSSTTPGGGRPTQRLRRIPERYQDCDLSGNSRRRRCDTRPTSRRGSFNPDALPEHTRAAYILQQPIEVSLIDALRDPERESIRTSINNAWVKLDEYYSLLGQSPLFTAAVILNPDVGILWLEDAWTSEEELGWLRDAKTGLKEYFERWYAEDDELLASPEPLPPPRAEESGWRQWLRSRQVRRSVVGTELERYYRLEPEAVDDLV